jgi:hypothetical protein
MVLNVCLTQKWDCGLRQIKKVQKSYLILSYLILLYIRVERNWNTQKLIRPIVRKDVCIYLLEHIFKKMGSTEIVVSSVRPFVRPSVSYFSGAIAPRELKFSTLVCCFTVVNSTVWDLGSVAKESGNLALTRTLSKKIHFYKHNSSSCGSNWTNEGSFEKS